MEIFIFAVYFFISVSTSESKYGKAYYRPILFLVTLFFIIWAGFRTDFWPDTTGYVWHFIEKTPDIFNFSFREENILYVEKGYYFLTSLIRTFTDSRVAYLMIIAALGLTLIYKGLNKYCVFPLIGMAVYIARFVFGRHFIQIRSGLSIALIFWGMQFVTNRDWRKWFLTLFFAYLLHTSALVALPVYFLNRLKLNKSRIVWGVIIAFIIAIFFRGPMTSFIQDASTDTNLGTAYTTGDRNYYKSAEGKGLANPMLYYQTVILLAFTFGEKLLKDKTKHYYTLRDGYFYSTVSLIALNMYQILSGRVSTIFATYEILIVPLLIMLFPQKLRSIGFLGVTAIYCAIFYMNYY